MESCLGRRDLDAYFEVLGLTKSIVKLYGVGSLHILSSVAFTDTDFNCGSLINLMMRLILQKCDKTEVNLQEAKGTIKGAKAFKQMN